MTAFGPIEFELARRAEHAGAGLSHVALARALREDRTAFLLEELGLTAGDLEDLDDEARRGIETAAMGDPYSLAGVVAVIRLAADQARLGEMIRHARRAS